MRSQALHCTGIVAHALHVKSGNREARAAWWNELDDHIAEGSDTVLLIDANARLGSETSEAVGGEGLCEKQCDNGAFVHRLLLDNKMCAPSTLMAITIADAI